ncbi:MAG: retroviral-like aspartic protease family protein [Flavisolibacter sp.]
MNLEEILRQNSYTAIPLRATQFGHLEINAAINDIPVLLLVDTGAASTVIDIDFAREKELPLLETTIMGGGVGTSELVIFQLQPVQLMLHALPFPETTLYAADLQHVKQSLLDKGETQLPCGVIGADILFERNAVIDYRNLLLYLQQ